MLIVFLAAELAAQIPLHLECRGSGRTTKEDTTSAYVSNSSGDSAQGQITSSRDVQFSDAVDVHLFSGDDRIRVPSTMLPPIRGGNAGWFKMKLTEVNDREILGSAAINFMNNPKIRIDRITGTINISGRSGDFTGQCHALAADAKPQF